MLEPICKVTQDGEYLSRLIESGDLPNKSRQATGKSGLSTTTSHSIRSSESVTTAVARPFLCSTEVTVVLYLKITPCFSAAAASARGTACMPPFGKKTPFTESM
ncbi:unannotated protein [freshwater metagenome]|uniref:Unannotated protein n=1 Tax=freshwater metagenome TaxID=449393 RepID=A0A6J6M621_9ZZZZ